MEFDLSGADLTRANLVAATIRPQLQYGVLHKGSIRNAVLFNANLAFATITSIATAGADFRGAFLIGATFCDVDLQGADFSGSKLGLSSFSNADLSQARGLLAVTHTAPSSIDVGTLRRSQGKIAPEFLRGCGLSELEIIMSRLYERDLTASEITDITYQIDLRRGTSPIQISPLFISYTHADTAFVQALEKLFDERGIRYWRDVHDLVAGRLEKQIEVAIRMNPTVILILSKQSVTSDWVEWEAYRARELEKELGRDVLCPVALDESWKNCEWEGPLRKQITKYNVLDFSQWANPKTMMRQFERLIAGLGLYYR